MPLFLNSDPLPVENPGERHIPCVLLVDSSSSMRGAPIAELNEGLQAFGDALSEDSLALGRAEVCVISFNSNVETIVPFCPASQFQPPKISATGLTSLNGAVNAGLDVLEERKQFYRSQSVNYYRPWLFLLTDGAPTDNELLDHTRDRLRSAISSGKVNYIPMGIGNADASLLRSYYPDAEGPVLKASANEFKEAFVWLSASVSETVRSNPLLASSIDLPPTPSTITVGI